MRATCVILVFFSIFFVVGSQKQDDLYAALHKCYNLTDVEPDVVSELFLVPDAKTDDPNVKCFFKCYMEEIKWMNSNGDLVEGPNYEFEEGLLEVLKECMKLISEQDLCEKAYKYSKCITEKKNKN